MNIVLFESHFPAIRKQRGHVFGPKTEGRKSDFLLDKNKISTFYPIQVKKIEKSKKNKPKNKERKRQKTVLAVGLRWWSNI